MKTENGLEFRSDSVCEIGHFPLYKKKKFQVKETSSTDPFSFLFLTVVHYFKCYRSDIYFQTGLYPRCNIGPGIIWANFGR